MNIVQLGSNDGNDHVFQFAKNNKNEIDFILLIDANPACVQKCSQTYKDFPQAQFENVAIVESDQQKEIVLWVPKRESTSNYSSLLASHVNHHEGNQNKGLNQIIVPATTLPELFLKYNITALDWLFMDLEGLDAPILLSLDFMSLNIKNIVFERTHTDGPFTCAANYSKLINYLEKSYYSIEYNKFSDINNILAKRQ